jgi:cytoskeletal protein RodZ
VTEVLSVEKEIGAHLRQARESVGLSLEQLQDKTKIQKSFITAIENGEFDKLPSPFYVRTYLRAYCKCVKLEPHHILRQYRKSEQAERGLTSVQQAITPEMLAQAQQMYQNGEMLQNTALGDTVVPRVSRTQAHTALTIAKSKPTAAATTTTTTTTTSLTPINNLTSGVTSSDLSASLNSSKLAETMIKRKESTRHHTDSRIENPRARPVLEQRGFSLSARKKATEEIEEPKPRMQRPVEQVVKEVAASKFVDGLTRSKRGGKEQTERKKTERMQTTTPPILERSNRYNATSTVSADVTQKSVPQQSRKLSRSASRRRAASNSSWLTKKSTLITIASVVICIPLLWATVAAIVGDEPAENKPTTEQVVQEPSLTVPNTQADNETSNEQVTLVEGSTYEVSGTDVVTLQFEATEQSWVQIRTQEEAQKEGYLSDATLQSGDSDKYEHNFADGEDVWISLGMPDAIKVTVNGKEVESAGKIHIKKK